MYKKTTKETIMGKIGTAVSGVSGIVYYDYQRQYDQAINKAKAPGCFINDLIVEKQTLLSDITRNELTVGIVAWVHVEDNENVGTQLNAFVELIQTALTTDRTLGGEAYYLIIEDISTDGGNRHPQGVAVMTLVVTFFSAD